MKKLLATLASLALLAGCASNYENRDSGGVGSGSMMDVGGSEAPGYDTEIDSQHGVYNPE